MGLKQMLGGIAGAISVLLSGANAGPNDTDWVQLFNRVDLKDWDIKFTGYPLNENYKNTFYVKDSLLMVDYSGYTGFTNQWGHAANKKRAYSYYLLRAEYSPGANQVSGGPGWAVQNNGLMLHSQSMASMSLNQDYPISMECQLKGSKNGATLNLCTPGTAYYSTATGGSVNVTHCTNISGSPAPAADAWAWATALVLGDSIIRHYNGKGAGSAPVFTYYRTVYNNADGTVSNLPAGSPAAGTPLKSGYIAIQAESAPYRFRNIELVNLEGCMTPGNANYKSYFVHNDPAACNTVNVGQAAGTDARFAVSPAFATFAPASELRRIAIFGSDGRQVALLDVPAGAGEIRMPNLTRGVYYAKLSAARGSLTSRLAIY